MSGPVGHPKNQHTVQRALLKGFAGPDQSLLCKDRAGIDRKIATKHATTQDDFYTFIDGAGTKRLDIDIALQKRLETHFPVYREAVVTDTLRPRQRREFDLYVAFSLMRTQTIREFMNQADRFAGPYARLIEMAARYGRDLAQLSPTEKLELDRAGLAMVRGKPGGERAERIRRLRTFVDLADNAFKSLQQLSWSAYKFPNPTLITSDAGVGVLRPEKDPGGVMPRGGIVVVPMGPNSLVLAATKRQHALMRDDDELARRVNQALADAAYFETYRRPDIPWPDNVRLDPEGPRLDIQIVKPTPRRPIPEDATAALSERYARQTMHPFTRGLLEILLEALPLRPTSEE